MKISGLRAFCSIFRYGSELSMRFDVEPSVKVGVLVSPSLNDVAQALD